jgi:hypothetical protein
MARTSIAFVVRFSLPAAALRWKRMTPDNELITRYLQTGSEKDFAELVNRHLDMVHSVALRVVNGDNHLAEDVAQAVFADLVRKARSLRGRPSLAPHQR